MPGKDDLVDAFDDDDLKRSIEAADGLGPWRDAGARFVDPKLRAIAEQLAHAPTRTYRERRLAELDRRAARKAAPAGPPPNPFEADLARLDDGAGIDAGSPVLAAPPPGGPPPHTHHQPLSAPQGAASRGSLRVDWLATVIAAWLVFAVAMAAQGLASGFTTGLYWRSAVTGTLVGVAWCWLGAGRFRAAAIGLSAHLIAFLGIAGQGSTTETLGVFLAMLLVLLGSGAVGLARESRNVRG